jgi:hypothetical protein
MAEHTIEEKKIRCFVNTGFRVTHKTGHAAISTFIAYIKVCVETFSLHTSTSGIKSHCLYVLNRAKRNKHQSNR